MAKFVYQMQNILDIKLKLETQAKMAYSAANQKYLDEQNVLQEYIIRRMGYEKKFKKCHDRKVGYGRSISCTS